MLYCNKCKKEVVIYGISHYPGADKDVEEMSKKIEEEGKLILFNPPPFRPYRCPVCGTELEEEIQ
ncbi:MAG: hypothetical protein ACTSRG_15055 [Candidatus Helarchaeota archaeon]